VALIFSFSACSEDANNLSNSKTYEKAGFDWPTIIFGTRSHPCGKDEGCYCTGSKGICLLINPEKTDEEPSSMPAGHGLGQWEVLPGGSTMAISILNDYEQLTSSDFTVISNITLSTETAGNLGYNTVVIKQGVYTVDYSEFSHGRVIVDIISN
jgi:hypothetical protein